MKSLNLSPVKEGCSSNAIRLKNVTSSFLRFMLRCCKILFLCLYKDGRLIATRVVFDLEPSVRLIGRKILKTQLLIHLSQLFIKSYLILIFFSLLSLFPGFLLPLQPYFLQIHFFGSVDNFINLFIMLSRKSSLPICFGKLKQHIFDSIGKSCGHVTNIISFASQSEQIYVVVSIG